MIDFKPIEDFTFDDCVKSLDRHRAEGTLPDEELLSRYNSLLEILKAEEKRDYPSVKTIDRLERYIKKYSNLTTATKYVPQYLTKAKQELAEQKRSAKRKKNTKVISCIGIIFTALIILFIIGYKSPCNLNCAPNEYLVHANGTNEALLCVVPNDNNIKLYSDNKNWQPHIVGDTLFLSADKNRDKELHGEIELTSCATLYGIPIEFIKTKKIINLFQESGQGTFLNVQDNVLISGIGGHISIPIATDGVWEAYKHERDDWYSLTCLRDSLQIYVKSNQLSDDRESEIQININSLKSGESVIIKTITLQQRAFSSFSIDIGDAEVELIEEFGFHYLKVGKTFDFDYLQDKELDIFVSLKDSDGREIDTALVTYTPSKQSETSKIYFKFSASSINKFADNGGGAAYGFFEVHSSGRKIPTLMTRTDEDPQYTSKQWLFRTK